MKTKVIMEARYSLSIDYWLQIGTMIRPIPEMFWVSGSIFLCKTDLLHWTLFHGHCSGDHWMAGISLLVISLHHYKTIFVQNDFFEQRCSYLSTIQIEGNFEFSTVVMNDNSYKSFPPFKCWEMRLHALGVVYESDNSSYFLLMSCMWYKMFNRFFHNAHMHILMVPSLDDLFMSSITYHQFKMVNENMAKHFSFDSS